MLDSEPTDSTGPTDSGAAETTTRATAPRKRAPRKAAKAAGAPTAAADAPDTSGPGAAGPNATGPNAPGSSAAGSNVTGPDDASDPPAPVKPARRSRRATAPVTAPSDGSNSSDAPGATGAAPTGSAPDATEPIMAAASPLDSGAGGGSTAPTRSRTRATKATRVTKSVAADPANAGSAGTGVADADGTDPVAQTADGAAPVTSAPRRRSRSAAGAPPASSAPPALFDTTSESAIAAPADRTSADSTPVESTPVESTPPARAPRKRGARKAAAPRATQDPGGDTPDGVDGPSEVQADADPQTAAPARVAVPVLFVAPGAADAEAPAPAARRRRRATSAVAAPNPVVELDELTLDPAASVDAHAELEARADAAPTDDADDPGRRRRRRGRRGRGARSEDDVETDDDEPRDGVAGATHVDSDTADADADDSGEADDGDSETTASRRRRRRRRGSSADSSETHPDDPPNTVVHVRTQRGGGAGNNGGGNNGGGTSASSRSGGSGSSDDEVRGIRGSSRLEAKRQRRREGRDNGRRRVPILTEAEFLARRESVDRLMAVRQRGDRTQIAILEDGVLVEHYVTRASATSYVGNVYLGRVQNVLPSMEAAFVDIGKGRNGVLYAGEVNWDAAGLEGKARAIEAAMKSGDALLVQVTKDPIGHKGARLTSQISLPGRFLVLVPNGGMTGISRKLPDTERHRLKAILKKIVPEDAGVIVRTAAEGASEEDLTSDMDRLKSQWEAISAHAGKPSDAPALVHGEPDLAIRVVRDVFNEDFESMVVEDGDNGSGAWEEISGYLSSVAPELAARARRHTGDTDLFHELRVDEQLAKALDRKVWLPSGGSLVIDRTEAMVVIDVNTGKFTGSGGNLEQTVTRNNLEAAEEIVRQLRLRDVGGIIVIDFIDMVLESNRDLVLRRLTECLGRDRTKHQVAEVTSLGLVQMTRKRVGEGLLEAFSEPCDKCHGRGVLVFTEPVDQPHRHDIDDGPARGNGNANGSGNGNGNAGGSGNGSGNGSASGRRNRRGRGQRDDTPVVEEHDDDPERRARAAAAMNAIARHTLAVESSAALQVDADEMPEAALTMDDDGYADAASSAGIDEAIAEAEVRADVSAALDDLPADLIDAALDTLDALDDELDGDQTGEDGSDPLNLDPIPDPIGISTASRTEGDGVGDVVDSDDVAQAPSPVNETSSGNGRPRRRRAARRPAGPPVHV